MVIFKNHPTHTHAPLSLPSAIQQYWECKRCSDVLQPNTSFRKFSFLITVKSNQFKVSPKNPTFFFNECPQHLIGYSRYTILTYLHVFHKINTEENTKLLKYCVIIESTTLMCLSKVNVFLYHTKTSSSFNNFNKSTYRSRADSQSLGKLKL